MKKKSLRNFYLLGIIIVFWIGILYLVNNINEPFDTIPGTTDESVELDKNIFLLWLQGWKHAEWLNLQVAESWEINNPGWKIHYIDLNNLRDYVTDIDYIYDTNKDISPPAKSDIIRLSLLKNHGGIWADATMLCMQPLDHWVFDAVRPSGLWMYHGNGADMSNETGPASWFIVSKKNAYMISQWKQACDNYWNKNDSTENYYWLDGLFKELYHSDTPFRQKWDITPYLYCNTDGQSHTLATHQIEEHTPHIQALFLEKPPYVLKLWKHWKDVCPNVQDEKCAKSNAYKAIQLSKRKFIYKHDMS